MKVTIEVELDECYEEQIFKNTVYDNRHTGYTGGLTEHSLRALLEQVDGQADPSFHKYNSDKEEDIRIETKVDLLRMCELNGVTVKVKL